MYTLGQAPKVREWFSLPPSPPFFSALPSPLPSPPTVDQLLTCRRRVKRKGVDGEVARLLACCGAHGTAAVAPRIARTVSARFRFCCVLGVGIPGLWTISSLQPAQPVLFTYVERRPTYCRLVTVTSLSTCRPDTSHPTRLVWTR